MLESHHKIFRPINAYNDLSCSSPFSILFLVNDTSRRLQKRKGGGGSITELYSIFAKLTLCVFRNVAAH